MNIADYKDIEDVIWYNGPLASILEDDFGTRFFLSWVSEDDDYQYYIVKFNFLKDLELVKKKEIDYHMFLVELEEYTIWKMYKRTGDIKEYIVPAELLSKKEYLPARGVYLYE